MKNDTIILSRNFVNSKEIETLSRILESDKFRALGMLMDWLYRTARPREFGEEKLTPLELDEEMGYEGFTAAMLLINRADLTEEGTIIVATPACHTHNQSCQHHL